MNNLINEWLDKILSINTPSNIVALNFNLYEDSNYMWSIDIVGTSSFDLNDSDWACDEIFDFNTRNNPLSFKLETNYEDVLKQITTYITNYLSNGKYKDTLKSYKGIGIGFVDGDLNILYCK